MLVTIRVEDCPHLQIWLGVHPVLDLPVDFSAGPLNIESVPLPVVFRAHHQISRAELEAFKALRIFLELKLPLSHLLLTFLVFFEYLEQILTFVDLPRSISVGYHREILHQSEVSSHCVGESRESAEFREKQAFSASLAIFVNQERLLRVGDGLLVLSGEVVSERDGLFTFLERRFGTLLKVNSFNTIRPLVVPKLNVKIAANRLTL